MKKYCIICDVDGTSFIMVDRGPYDWSKVDTDLPNRPLMHIMKLLQATNFYAIIFTSGRKEQCRNATTDQIAHHLGDDNFQLMMRADDDNRPDAVVKQEMLDLITSMYEPVCVFDDRQQVVDMWLANGLNCIQVEARIADTKMRMASPLPATGWETLTGDNDG